MYGFDKSDVKSLGKYFDKIPNNLNTRRGNSITQPQYYTQDD